MNTARKAKAARAGTMADFAEGGTNERQVSRIDCTTFHSPLSSLLDQALSRFETHADLARYHAAQAEKHRAILTSLQSLVPPGKRGKGGAA